MVRTTLGRGAVIGFALAVGACASVPSLGPKSQVSVDDIVSQVECELQAAVRDYGPKYPQIYSWAAGFELNFQVDATSGVTPGSTLVRTITDGTLTFGLGGGVNNTASRTNTIKYDAVALRDLPKGTCDITDANGAGLRGELGIYQWIGKMVQTSYRKGKPYSAPLSFGHTVQFVIKRSASLSPTIVISGDTGTGALSAERSDTHSLLIAFARALEIPPTKSQKGAGPSTRNLIDRSIEGMKFQTIFPLRVQ